MRLRRQLRHGGEPLRAAGHGANLWRTVQAFEQAGVAAIHIEDHEGPGKHTDAPQRLRPAGRWRRVGKPAMVVDMPGRSLAEHQDAAIVLYYAFSVLSVFRSLESSLEHFRASGEAPAGAEALETFLDYRGFAERAKRYTG